MAKRAQSLLFRAEHDEGFLRFWAAYPNKVGKLDAFRAWFELQPTPEVIDQILDALAWQRSQRSWVRDQGEYIPHPASWIRAGRWMDVKPLASGIEVNEQGETWQQECERLHGRECNGRSAHWQRRQVETS